MIDLAAPPFTLLAERDMDLLVLEEMLSSDPFKKWLVSKLYNGTRQFRRMIGAWHTPSLEPLGSVDILFDFEEISAGHKCAILIENKIDRSKISRRSGILNSGKKAWKTDTGTNI